MFVADPIKYIVCGRIAPEKGIHTVIEAFGSLSLRRNGPSAILTIIGNGPSSYVSSLKARIEAHGLVGVVQILPGVDRAGIPLALAEHDVLILASEYDEPLARAPQEAMAMGLLAVLSDAGGNTELVSDRVTGLTFPAGDAAALADRLAAISANREWASQLADRGTAFVPTHYAIERTVREIETYLAPVAGASHHVAGTS